MPRSRKLELCLRTPTYPHGIVLKKISTGFSQRWVWRVLFATQRYISELSAYVNQKHIQDVRHFDDVTNICEFLEQSNKGVLLGTVLVMLSRYVITAQQWWKADSDLFSNQMPWCSYKLSVLPIVSCDMSVLILDSLLLNLQSQAAHAQYKFWSLVQGD